jgi:DNA end-binding protein Ku
MQKMIHPETGEEVPNEEIRRGYQIEKGVFVILDPEELESIEPKASRDIEVMSFVDPDLLDHRWYERPYFLAPDGSDDSYRALHDAQEKEGTEGVVRWTMRNRSYVGALRVENGGLVLVSLRHAGEVVSTEELPQPSGRALDKKERSMAKGLVDALSEDFDPSEWQDQYRKRVMELVETKAQGGEVKLKKFKPRKTADDSLSDALEASLKELKKKGA